MRKIIFFPIVVVLLFVIGFSFKNNIYRSYLDFSGRLPEIQKGVGEIVDQIQKNISTPPPLRSSKENPSASLSKAEVIKFTNAERNKAGLSSLEENSQLSLSAEAKAEDMLSRQYFEHESPTGERVSDLVEQVDYQFIVLGENLAMGNFESNQDLVRAWMDSPGHRENILNSNYKEIGVAVVRGTFEGRTTWMAVQHFAAPLNNCPEIDESLRGIIEKNQIEIQELQEALDSMRDHIKNRRSAEEYNSLVDEYNKLVAQNKMLVSEYNNQVREFNECLSNFK